jgi:benzoyl-CoA reductase subunit C
MSTDNNLILESKLPNPAVQAWKEKGNKVIGTICCHVPEELINAAGVMPYRIRATGSTEDSQGEVWLSQLSCNFCRSCMQYIADGTYDFLDGIAASDGCLMAQRLYDSWRYSGERNFAHLVTAPRMTTEAGGEWYRDELVKFKEELEKFTGKTITDEALQASVQTYNETRRLIRELYDLRKSKAPVISGAESLQLVLAAMSMPKEQYNEQLSKYLQEVKNNEPITDYKARLMVMGSPIDDPKFIKMIEDKGGLVVTDLQCFGSRYMWEPVEGEGDVLTSLASFYLKRPTCPRMMDQYQNLFDLVKEMVKEFKVDGVIYENVRYCDMWGGANQIFEKRFKEANIPVLALEREEIMTNELQLAVRVEAFIETLEEEGI